MKQLELVGSLWARWQMARRDLFSVDIRQALQFGGRALILLPSDPKLTEPAIQAAERLAKWFDPVNTIWMGMKDDVPDIPVTSLSFAAIPSAVNRWGLPYGPLVKKVEALSPQVAIDLNPTFLQPSAYLCVVSGAQLRIGFRAPTDGYFNLQYAWGDDSLPLTDHYDRFISMLGQLRSSPAD